MAEAAPVILREVPEAILESPRSEFLDRLLTFGLEHGASDLHLTLGVPPVYRIDGEIILAKAEGLTADQLKRTLYEVLTAEQQREFERELQLCFTYTPGALGFFRVNLYLQRGAVEAAIRLGMNRVRPLESLGLPSVVEDFTRKPIGLVLITGATGVGKTTTFNAMVDFVNRERRCKIITIEDPIEYFHENKRAIVIQQELHSDFRSFSSALVHLLRQDPDLIGVGEMRDLDTISTALTAAETGHLVFATLHTPNASQTIDRIIDSFPPHQQSQVRVQLAACLQGVVSQQLLPRADASGRVLAAEVLVATTAVRNLIRENSNESMLRSTMETSRGQGMVLMDSALRDLYQRGEITYDTARSTALDPDRIRDNG